MRTVIEIINEANNKFKELGLEQSFKVSKPQKLSNIEKIEKKFKIKFPDDYKNFITTFGLLHFDLYGDGNNENWNKMLGKEDDMEMQIEELQETLIDDQGIDENIAKKIIPFQYLVDDGLQEYYVFRYVNDNINVFNLNEQWDRLEDEDSEYASTFTEHIELYVMEILKKEIS